MCFTVVNYLYELRSGMRSEWLPPEKIKRPGRDGHSVWLNAYLARNWRADARLKRAFIGTNQIQDLSREYFESYLLLSYYDVQFVYLCSVISFYVLDRDPR